MSPDDYSAWRREHSTLFQMHRAEDVDLFAAWWPMLSAYTLAELTEASRWVAMERPEHYRTEHLKLLRSRVRERRREAFQASLKGYEDGPTVCGLCNGTGLVPVPHVADVADMEWKYRGSGKVEMVVSCRCPRGESRASMFEQVRSETAGRVQSMTLAEYEACVPNWRELMAARPAEMRAERNAEERARSIDRKHGPLSVAKDLAKRFGKGGG